MSCVGIVYKGGRNFDPLLTKDRHPHIPSMGFNLLSLVTTVILTVGTNAAIGPVADLHIVNKDLSPDGFQRPTVLAEGVFPGPLIKGNKVSACSAKFAIVPF